MAYYVSDINRARAFYRDFLGFEQAFCLKNSDGSDHVCYLKINDRQYILLYAEHAKNHGFLHDIAFETNDAVAAYKALAAKGAKVSESVGNDQSGDLMFEVTDPYGFTIQVIQYLPGSMTGKTAGKFMPANRISEAIDHVGLLLGDRATAAKFYADTFGFVSEGDGSKQRIGDGPDRFELGFERKPPTIDRFHVKDHICLSVRDVPTVAARLRAKPAAKNFREIETHQLDNGKNVAELYDPDGNRVELMEPPKQ
jgi:lactoylglutathione lyase